LGRLLALLHLEGVAAAARGGDVRVVDREPGLEAVDPVDLGAREVRGRERVDDDRDPVRLDLAVALLGAAVEAERVLEAGAAAALDGETQDLGLARGLLGLELLDLGRRALGEGHDPGVLLGGRHGFIVAASSAVAAALLVTPVAGMVERKRAPLVALCGLVSSRRLGGRRADRVRHRLDPRPVGALYLLRGAGAGHPVLDDRDVVRVRDPAQASY